MALLYSKDEELEIDSNGDLVGKKKVQGKKRRLDSTGERQPKVLSYIFQIWIVGNNSYGKFKQMMKGTKNNKAIKNNKKPKMIKKGEGKKRQNINESENEEDCAADQCLKVITEFNFNIGPFFQYIFFVFLFA